MGNQNRVGLTGNLQFGLDTYIGFNSIQSRRATRLIIIHSFSLGRPGTASAGTFSLSRILFPLFLRFFLCILFFIWPTEEHHDAS